MLTKAVAWGFTEASLSNGAAYADLDNDGDLDLIINNINAPASVYRNNAQEQKRNNYLSIELKGEGINKFGFGSKLVVKNNGNMQISYVTSTRGFESSSVSLVHFGMGKESSVDTLQIIWPDGKVQTLTNVSANQPISLIAERCEVLRRQSTWRKL